MKKQINKVEIQGYVFEQNLALSKVKNTESKNFGKDFIQGNLQIATDEEGLNVVTVHFTYVSPLTNKGTPNNTFKVLKDIMAGPQWIKDGKEKALKVKIQTAIALNEFPDKQGKRITSKRCEGGFVNIVSSLTDDITKRCTFTTDMVITRVSHVDASEKIKEDFTRVSGYIFNFRNEIIPITYSVRNPLGMKFFEENLDGVTEAEPVYTKVWGKIINTVNKTPNVIESAFGGEENSLVEIQETPIKDWIIIGTSKVPYEFNDEKTITQDEIVKALQDREVKWAETVKNREEYLASQQEKQNNPIVSSAVPTGTVTNTVGIDPSNWKF